MQPTAAQRAILVQAILAEAVKFHNLKLNFPYDPPVDFERTGDVFERFGCYYNWRGVEWDGTSASILCRLFSQLRRNVRYVREIQNLCAQFVRDVEMSSFSSRT